MCLDVSTSRHKNLILSFSLTPKLRQGTQPWTNYPGTFSAASSRGVVDGTWTMLFQCTRHSMRHSFPSCQCRLGKSLIFPDSAILSYQLMHLIFLLLSTHDRVFFGQLFPIIKLHCFRRGFFLPS